MLDYQRILIPWNAIVPSSQTPMSPVSLSCLWAESPLKSRLKWRKLAVTRTSTANVNSSVTQIKTRHTLSTWIFSPPAMTCHLNWLVMDRPMDREDTVTHLENQAWIDCEKKLGDMTAMTWHDLTVVDFFWQIACPCARIHSPPAKDLKKSGVSGILHILSIFRIFQNIIWIIW